MLIALRTTEMYDRAPDKSQLRQFLLRPDETEHWKIIIHAARGNTAMNVRLPFSSAPRRACASSCSLHALIFVPTSLLLPSFSLPPFLACGPCSLSQSSRALASLPLPVKQFRHSVAPNFRSQQMHHYFSVIADPCS